VAESNKVSLEFMVPRLIKNIMEDMAVTEGEALTLFYSSKLCEKMEREETKLWHLSVPTLYQMFREELDTGHITYPEEV